MVSAFVGVTEFEAGITALVTMTVKAAVYGLFLPIAIALMVL